MISSRNSKNKLASILLAGLFFNSVNAQDKIDYYNFGLNLSSEHLNSRNQANAVDYNLHNTQTFNFGLSYRLSKKEFEYIFTANVRRFNMVNSSSFKGEDIPDPLGYTSETTLYDSFNYKLSATINKVLIRSKTLDVYFGIGPELLIYPEDPITGEFVFITETEEVGYTEKGNSANGKNPFYLGVNANLGLNFKTKYLLINPYLTYHYQRENIFNNVVTTQNLYVSENTVSKHSIKGSYLGFGVNIYPSQSIFKKKN